jgi:hypothetical protein
VTPTAEQVWRAIEKASFLVLGFVTPAGEPRSSGVVYKALGRRLYVVTAPDSFKSRVLAANSQAGDNSVSVVVPVRRGGVLSLVAPIPPATITFRGTATLHPADRPESRPVIEAMGSLLPAERRTGSELIEIVPVGDFLTYGIGVSLTDLRDPAKAQGRVPVS